MNTSYYGATVLEIFSEARGLQITVMKDGRYEPLTSSFLTVSWPAPFSSQPHGIPKVDDRLCNGPLVAMSFIRINGYASEVERTYFHQTPSKDEQELFHHMINARKAAFDLVKPGVNCSDVDQAANDYLRKEGLSEYLLHRTGHGIGMGNHEGPYIAEGSSDILEENMVISIEPGIYLPDIGGFRHSDTVLVTASGAEYLTKYSTDIDSLTITDYKISKRLKGKLVRRAVGIK
jgi:Xaa-Pro aminopeptidase